MRDGNGTRDDGPHRSAETYRLTYDPASGAPPSHALVVGVADISGVDPIDLEPLHGVVDPGLVDEFVGEDGLPTVDGHISFPFAGYRVTVFPSGLFEVTPDG